MLVDSYKRACEAGDVTIEKLASVRIVELAVI
jgi:hypothetical protein